MKKITFENIIVFIGVVIFFILSGYWLYTGFLLSPQGAGSDICYSASGDVYYCGD